MSKVTLDYADAFFILDVLQTTAPSAALPEAEAKARHDKAAHILRSVLIEALFVVDPKIPEDELRHVDPNGNVTIVKLKK